MGKKRVNFFIGEKQIEGLKKLSEVTRVPVSVFVREAIDDLLRKYEKEIKKAKKERG